MYTDLKTFGNICHLMVNKNLKDYLEAYVESEIGRSIPPYQTENDISSEDSREILRDFNEEYGIEDFEELILHGAPSEEENEVRYDLLEKAAFHLQSRGKRPEFVVPEAFRENIESSEILHTDSVNYCDPSITEDEIAQSSNWSRIHVTSDYHSEAVDNLSSNFDKEDFIVLSAATEKGAFPKEEYTQILGPAQDAAAKLPVDWKTWAEGKEIGRKLLDKLRGQRF